MVQWAGEAEANTINARHLQVCNAIFGRHHSSRHVQPVVDIHVNAVCDTTWTGEFNQLSSGRTIPKECWCRDFAVAHAVAETLAFPLVQHMWGHQGDTVPIISQLVDSCTRLKECGGTLSAEASEIIRDEFLSHLLLKSLKVLNCATPVRSANFRIEL